MHRPLQLQTQFPKLAKQPAVGTTSGCKFDSSQRLFVVDIKTQRRFLVDTGSDLSIFPRRLLREDRRRTNFDLSAANNSAIFTYGMLPTNLNLGLRREFCWRFIVADIAEPIIGADFLGHYHLLPDIKQGRLIDHTTGLSVSGFRINSAQPSIKTVTGLSCFHDLLTHFPDIVRPAGVPREVRHRTAHHIRTTPGPPVSCRARRLAPDNLHSAKSEFELMVREGIARRSDSPWSSPLHMVAKKNNEWRPCGDYRALNTRTVPDRYPVRHIMDFSHALHGCSIFSTVDCAKAFTQIPVAPEDVPKTAIITPFGLFEFPFMGFGLRNAAQTWQRFIDEVLRELPFCFAYLDDILVFSKDKDEHRGHLRALFQRLTDYGVIINSAKCVFGVSEVTFLGYTVSTAGCRPLKDKVIAIKDFPQPRTVRALRRFLGMLNFYRRHIPHAAAFQQPLNALLSGPKVKGSTPISWTPELTAAFEQCKAGLSRAALLAHPDCSAPLALVVDASQKAIGAVLQQQTRKSWEPLAFYSKKLTEPQQKWSAYDRELLAMYQAVRYFRPMLEARDFIIFTDHKPLSCAASQRRNNCSPRQFNQLEFILQFTSDIRHISGEQNIVADCLSRVDSVTATIDFASLSRAQEEDEELSGLLQGGSSLRLEKLLIPGTQTTLYCDISTGRSRPYLTTAFRRQAFDSLHGLSHPGANATVKLVSGKYVWRSINRDCRAWARACPSCQQCKIARHVSSPLGDFTVPSERFAHVHMDLVGPLPPSDGYKYCLTLIDRYSRWPEAIPLRDITAETVARAFVFTWVSRFGCPIRVTTDRGQQFESQLFKAIAKLCGISLSRTTSYHPQSNGILERWHRTLKAAIMSQGNITWTESLPLVLLGLRTTWKPELQSSVAEMVYGETLRVPGEFLNPSNSPTDPADFVDRLRSHISRLRPIPASRHSRPDVFVHRNLAVCTHVMLRTDSLRAALQPPYTGPHPVLSRSDKTFDILLKGRRVTVSIDRLKPAYFIDDPASSEPTNSSDVDCSPSPVIPTEQLQSPPLLTPDDDQHPITITRSGRRVRFPDFSKA